MTCANCRYGRIKGTNFIECMHLRAKTSPGYSSWNMACGNHRPVKKLEFARRIFGAIIMFLGENIKEMREY